MIGCLSLENECGPVLYKGNGHSSVAWYPLARSANIGNLATQDSSAGSTAPYDLILDLLTR